MHGFFISLTLTGWKPSQCLGSPCGVLSRVPNPGTVCWASGDHMALVVLGIFGALRTSTGLADTASCSIALDRSGTTTEVYT